MVSAVYGKSYKALYLTLYISALDQILWFLAPTLLQFQLKWYE